MSKLSELREARAKVDRLAELVAHFQHEMRQAQALVARLEAEIVPHPPSQTVPGPPNPPHSLEGRFCLTCGGTCRHPRGPVP